MVKNLIVPPPDLVELWVNLLESRSDEDVFSLAAQWGADQELEACCEVLARELICDGKHVATDLRMIRRPKPPSLKEQALELTKPAGTKGAYVTFGPEELELISRALEQIND